MKSLDTVQEALCQFVINATKENAPSHAVAALPGVVCALLELTKVTRTQKCS